MSLFLAILMAGTAFVSCSDDAPNKTETGTAETEQAEVSTRTDLVTENGTAASHIVVAEGADQLISYASEELAYHIKLVSGADISVVNTALSDSLSIIIGTPDSVPELEELFPDDLVWLRTLSGEGENVRYGSDGFAVRQLEGKLYIFGATPRGALNGVYDFIEENMGVLWTRADESRGMIYDEMPTITVKKADYREKSPFDLRGWTLSGGSRETFVMMARNKLNGLCAGVGQTTEAYASLTAIGIEPFISNHNIKWWITQSPTFDPDCHEYWSTDMAGEHAVSAADSEQVNFWSDVTMQTIADHVIAFLDQHKESADIDYVGICLEDFDVPRVYPEMNEPYEYAPGQFADPGANNYISTVFFSFMNKIAQVVGEKYPDVKLHSYAYASVITPPECELEDNLYITFCPLGEDLCSPLGESQRDVANKQYEDLLGWMEITSNVQVYNYYGCYTAAPLFERPIWDRIQSDLQLYAANGFNGLVPEGFADVDAGWCTGPEYNINNDVREPYLTMSNGWSMNAMTFWIYSKLAWNPSENVDELIEFYCDKVWGEASADMQEYYRLLRLCWADGSETMSAEFNCYYTWSTSADMYWDYFLNIEVDGVCMVESIQETLHKAYDAANDEQKERLRYIVEVYDNAEALFYS